MLASTALAISVSQVVFERPVTVAFSAFTFTSPAVSPVELIVVPPALTLPVAVTLVTSRFGFNSTLIVLLALSAVTLIFLSPAKFNVVVPVSVGFTAIVFPLLSFAVQPASTF